MGLSYHLVSPFYDRIAGAIAETLFTQLEHYTYLIEDMICHTYYHHTKNDVSDYGRPLYSQHETAAHLCRPTIIDKNKKII